jgi:hypothetical protein
VPDYTCTTAACPSGGAPIVLNTANQTFCPQCFNNTLQPYVRPRMEQMVNAGGQMSAGSPDTNADCERLIQLFSITLVSTEEARMPRDCIVKLGSDRRKRIDRQGPVSNGNTITHARFAVQLGTPIYAGIHMPVDTTFTIGHIREAFRRSLAQGGYFRIFWG